MHHLALLSLLLLPALAQAYGPRWPSTAPVFTGGQEGYHCYRIPALVRLPNGTLLAFAEGRRFTCADHDWNDIVLKRSTDGGNTWSPLQVRYRSGKKGEIGDAQEELRSRYLSLIPTYRSHKSLLH